MDLLALPDTVLHSVLELLPASDLLLRVGLVNKRLHGLVQQEVRRYAQGADLGHRRRRRWSSPHSAPPAAVPVAPAPAPGPGESCDQQRTAVLHPFWHKPARGAAAHSRPSRLLPGALHRPPTCHTCPQNPWFSLAEQDEARRCAAASHDVPGRAKPPWLVAQAGLSGWAWGAAAMEGLVTAPGTALPLPPPPLPPFSRHVSVRALGTALLRCRCGQGLR